jgi:hypothetical protein
MLLGFTNKDCFNKPRPVPPIDYTSRLEALYVTMTQVLAEVRNHNQTVAIDWEPIINQMQAQIQSVNTVRTTVERVGAEQLAAAQRHYSDFLALVSQVSDFRAESMTNALNLLRVEQDQNGLLQDQINILGSINAALQPKPVVRTRRYTFHFRATITGALIRIAAGTFELQIDGLGCFVFLANDAPQECGRTICHSGSQDNPNHEWDLELPANAVIRIDYDAPVGFAAPEVVNADRLNLAEITALSAPDDEIALAEAVASAQNVVNSEHQS